MINKINVKQRNFRSRQLCLLGRIIRPLSQVMFFVLSVEAKELKLSIARWSELLNCDSALSKHARAYSVHPESPYSQMLKKFSTAVHFSIKFPLFFHLQPSLTFTLKLLPVVLLSMSQLKLFLNHKKISHWRFQASSRPSNVRCSQSYGTCFMFGKTSTSCKFTWHPVVESWDFMRHVTSSWEEACSC